MSAPERLPTNETPRDPDNLISISFGQVQEPESADDTTEIVERSVCISQSADQFMATQMAKYGISEHVVINHALESYEFFSSIVEDGGRIEIIDKYGRRYPVEDNLGKLPPAA